MSPIELICFIVGLYGCLSVTSFSFYAGHNGLDIYRDHALKQLGSLNLILVSTYYYHTNEAIVFIGFLFFIGSLSLFKYDFYSQIDELPKSKKEYENFFLILIPASLVVFLTLGKLECWILLFSYSIIPIHLIRLFLAGLFALKKSEKKISSNVRISWWFEVCFFLILFFISIFKALDQYIIIFVLLAIFHVLVLGLSLSQIVFDYLALQRDNRINRLHLKNQNLKEIEANILLEQKLGSAIYFSELASLDLGFISFVFQKIKNKIVSEKESAILIITKLAKHMRNHVYFKNASLSRIEEEINSLYHFKELCDVIYSPDDLTISILTEGNKTSTYVKSHIIFPLVKSVVTKSKRSEEDSKINVELTKNSDHVLIDIWPYSNSKYSFDISELGIPHIQSRLLEDKEVLGKFLEIEDQRITLMLTLNSSN